MLFRINSNHLCLHNFGEESCSVTMPRPFKFQTGRADCVEVDLTLRPIYQTHHVLERLRVWVQGDEGGGSPKSCWKWPFDYRVLPRLFCHDRQGGAVSLFFQFCGRKIEMIFKISF